MSTLIKAAEAWLPNEDGTQLTLGSACYGSLGDFEAISRSMFFKYGEGLPGQAWQQGHPIIWNDLSQDNFKRRNFLSDTGIECGIAIPIQAGSFLLGVLVLFCGKSRISGRAAGALEVWESGTHAPENELKLASGYFGDLERFEWVSRKLTIMKGFGLPGEAWEQGKPLLMKDLAESSSFLRAQNAAECGITTGMAIPLSNQPGGIHVVTMLSASGTPIAHQFEIWSPNEEGKLVFEDGYLHDIESEKLRDYFKDQSFERGQGPLGEAWLTGRPKISYQPGNATIILPVTYHGQLTAIIRFTL